MLSSIGICDILASLFVYLSIIEAGQIQSDYGVRIEKRPEQGEDGNYYFGRNWTGEEYPNRNTRLISSPISIYLADEENAQRIQEYASPVITPVNQPHSGNYVYRIQSTNAPLNIQRPLPFTPYGAIPNLNYVFNAAIRPFQAQPSQGYLNFRYSTYKTSGQPFVQRPYYIYYSSKPTPSPFGQSQTRVPAYFVPSQPRYPVPFSQSSKKLMAPFSLSKTVYSTSTASPYSGAYHRYNKDMRPTTSYTTVTNSDEIELQQIMEVTPQVDYHRTMAPEMKNKVESSPTTPSYTSPEEKAKTVSPEAIKQSISMLTNLLQTLQKAEQSRPDFSNDVQNSVTDYVSNTKKNKINLDLDPNMKFSKEEENEKGRGMTGRPGVDYPVYFSIPKTLFSCKTQRYKGFFADTETGCQVWHYCDLNGGQASFLCPNGTIFNQAALTCDWWFNVKCDLTTQLYVLNESLYKYILPAKPSFPEDYSGPVVDQYLEAKFREIEMKRKQTKFPNNATTLMDMFKAGLNETEPYDY